MENAPFFIGAVLAGNAVGLDACKSASCGSVEGDGMGSSSVYDWADGKCMLTMKLNSNDEHHGSVVYRSTRDIQFPVCEG